VIGF
jgi:hypothetical protein